MPTPTARITSALAAGSRRMTGPFSERRLKARLASTATSPIDGDRGGEAEAEGDDQGEAEADPVQRDRAQQDDERRGARQQAGRDADAEQAAPVDRVRSARDRASWLWPWW